MTLETFRKLPLGGIDRRALIELLAQDGLQKAMQLLSEQRHRVRTASISLPPKSGFVILGGSNGITRGLAIQLLFGERALVFCVHSDSEKLQIGPYHAKAMHMLAQQEGLHAQFWNEDATHPETLSRVVKSLKEQVQVVHLINGIAWGATKRYAKYGPAKVRELDVAFDPVLQTPDFSKPENIRKLGFVDVEVATDAEVERTNRFMGTSSWVWAKALAEEGLLVPKQSIVAFCDYDYEASDPVYAMGPLAGAKLLQRESMQRIRHEYGVLTARLCYPPLATTALGAIPGGLLQFAMSAQILKERNAFQDIPELAFESMRPWLPGWSGEDVHLDVVYQTIFSEFHRRKDALVPSDIPGAFSMLFEKDTIS